MYKEYKTTPRAKFIQAKNQAKYRNEGWDFTFEQWFGLWEASGQWENKGTSKGQFRMCRLNAVKPWGLDNVTITNVKNSYAIMNRELLRRPEIRHGAGHDDKCKPVVCDGKRYKSVRAAIDHYDKYPAWVRDRLRSAEYPKWYYVNDTQNT